MIKNQYLADADLYDKDYFLDHYLYDPKRKKMYELERERIEKMMPAGRTVLDIGCGTGEFLNGFSSKWTKYGIEPSPFASRVAIVNDVRILGDIDKVASFSVDLVIFRGTLQHISQPLEYLAEATRVLKRGGMIAILATPDTDSLVYSIFKTLPALEPGRNWVLFGSSYLENILKRLGYQYINTHHPYLGTPYARPAMDAVKFIISLILGYRKFAWPGNMMEIYATKK